jgi:hypothetical protein
LVLSSTTKSLFGSTFSLIFLQLQRCKKDETMQLKDGDLIRFGTNDSIFTLKRLDFNFCCSNLNSSMKTKLIESLGKIGNS